MCVSPIIVKGREVGCGMCYECQMLRRSEWSFRMQYETKIHPNAYFLTLTYNDEHLTHFDPLTLLHYPNYEHIQKFIKELRRSFKLKYFGVHEYGSVTKRKHYHLILWLLDESETLLLDRVQLLWQYGFVEKSSLNNARIHYVTKYLNKPFRKSNFSRDEILRRQISDREKLELLVSQFVRDNTFNFMSLKPAIGIELLNDVELCNYIVETTLETGFYPKLRLNGKEFSIPRYYLKKLFTPDERQAIYNASVDKRFDNYLMRARKLDIDLFELSKLSQMSDALKLERVNKIQPYEVI